MDRGAWRATVHGVTQGQEDLLEEEMATHSSILAWTIPWTKEPGGLQSMGSQESDSTLNNNNKSYFTSQLRKSQLFIQTDD